MKKFISLLVLLLLIGLLASCKSIDNKGLVSSAKEPDQSEKENDSVEESLDYIKGRLLTPEEIEEQKKHEPPFYGYQEDSIVIPSIREGSDSE